MAPQLAKRVSPRASSASSPCSAACQSAPPACNSFCDSHRAEDFPAAVRELLVHREHRATNVRRLAIRRCDIRSGEVPPLGCPSLPGTRVREFSSSCQPPCAPRNANTGTPAALRASRSRCTVRSDTASRSANTRPGSLPCACRSKRTDSKRSAFMAGG
jgi:hypothetical protein